MRITHELLRRLRDPRGQRADKGWAGRSLEGSIASTLLIGVAGWHGVMALAAISTLGLAGGAPVAALHVVALAGALAVLRCGRGQLALIVGSWALYLVAWTVSPAPESTLFFAACWLRNLTDALPAFLLRGRASWCAPLVAVVVIPALMPVVRPDLAGHPLVPSVVVVLTAITVATRIGLSYMLDYTEGVDAEARALEAKTASLTVSTAATHQAAEDARVLHDTAINTLGAIANGGVAIDDAEAVRRRCLADVAAIEALGSVTAEDMAARSGFRDGIRPIGICVRYAGLPDAEIARIEALLPARVLRAFNRAAAEAVQNAAKHSGADEVVVSITRSAEGVRMTIRDTGVGFQPELRRGGGIERSILARARDAGLAASLDSAPGQGTTVTLAYAFDEAPRETPAQAPAPESAGTVENLVRQLRSRAAFALSAGLVGVGVALAALNHPGEATPEWLMVAVVATACGLAWRERQRARLSAWTVTALIVAAPLAFVLSAWAVGFGLDRPCLWQAIAPTGPLLVLLIVSLPRAVKMLGFAAYLLTVALTAAGAATASAEAARITVLAGLAGAGLVGGLLRFVRELAAVATRAHLAQQETFAVGLKLAAVDAAAESRRRWREAGLERSAGLLRAVAERRADPKDPAVRQRCAEEEAFLRQLSLLNPELIQMGTWFARALNASRLRGVGLTVRAGAADATEDAAQALGATLLAVVDAMPAGTPLTTAMFATSTGLTMTLVAPTPHLISALNRDARRIDVRRLQTLGRQDLVELVVAGGS